MRVTVVHEWLTNRAGSEKVVDGLRQAFDDTTVMTSLFNQAEFPGWNDVHTSFLQRLGTGRNAQVVAAPLLPVAMRSLRVPPSDVVITSFHNFASATPVPAGIPHLVYCHTPTRFVHARESMSGERVGPLVARAVASAWRPVDRRLGRRGDRWLANSSFIADRIRRAYGRDAGVVHPPVEVERFRAALGTDVGDEFIYVGRLVPYKRPELAVRVCSELGVPLAVVGDGRDRARLEAMAGPTVRFLGHVDDDALPPLLAGARALIYPGVEDFGITVVEAMAAGTPVLAWGEGGLVETVDSTSGRFFRSEDELRRMLERDLPPFDRAAISASTDRFSLDRFVAEIRREVEDLLA